MAIHWDIYIACQNLVISEMVDGDIESNLDFSHLRTDHLPYPQRGMLTTYPPCNFSLEFKEIFSQNLLNYHSLSVSGISKIMHCGIITSMPNHLGLTYTTEDYRYNTSTIYDNRLIFWDLVVFDRNNLEK